MRCQSPRVQTPATSGQSVTPKKHIRNEVSRQHETLFICIFFWDMSYLSDWLSFLECGGFLSNQITSTSGGLKWLLFAHSLMFDLHCCRVAVGFFFFYWLIDWFRIWVILNSTTSCWEELLKYCLCYFEGQDFQQAILYYLLSSRLDLLILICCQHSVVVINTSFSHFWGWGFWISAFSFSFDRFPLHSNNRSVRFIEESKLPLGVIVK